MGSKSLVVSDSLKAASEKLALVIGSNPLEPVFKKAEVVIAVREWLQHPEVMEKIKQLRNTPSGFQTDEATRSGGPYDDKTLAVAVTDALAAGFALVGNEFNIINGRMMGVLNGYHRLVREWENDSHKLVALDVVEGDITVNGNLVKIPMVAHYTLLDKVNKTKATHKFERTIQVRQRGQNDTPDAWIGKASRRLLKKLHVFLSGQDLGDDLGDEGSVTGAAAATTPPVGKVDLAREKPAKAAPAAEEASWSPVEAGAPEKPEKKTKATEPPPPPPSEDVF